MAQRNEFNCSRQGSRVTCRRNYLRPLHLLSMNRAPPLESDVFSAEEENGKIIRTYMCSLEPPKELMDALRRRIEERKGKIAHEPFIYDYDVLKDRHRNNMLTVNTYRKTAAESIRMMCQHFSIQSVNFAKYIKGAYEKNLFFTNVEQNSFPIESSNTCNDFHCSNSSRPSNGRVLWRPQNKLPSFDTFTIRKLINGNKKIFQSQLMEIQQKYNTYMESISQDGGKYLAHSTQTIMLPMLNAYKDTLKKFRKFVSLVFKGDIDPDLTSMLRDSMAQFIVFGQANKFLCGVLANRLGATKKKLDLTYVRNTLVGWNRKFDSKLPKALPLESIPQNYNELGQELRKLQTSEEYYILISTLEKAKVLHLLGTEINLEPVL